MTTNRPTFDLPDDFGFTREHELLRQSARRLLGERCSLGEVRRLDRDERGFDPQFYRELVELGWVGLLLPEEVGGGGLDHLSMALLCEELGRALAPCPFWASMMAGLVLGECGGEQAERMRALASGERIGAVALNEAGRWEMNGGDFRLFGTATHVAWGAAADFVVAPFRSASGELALFAIDVPTAGVGVEPEVCVDRTRRTARLAFERVSIGAAARVDGGRAEAIWQRALARGRALLAAEMVGGSEAVLRMTRDYAIERTQFGRPIGSFQAVKHPLVNVMLAVEAARSLATGAACAFDVGHDQATLLARMAKASATDAYAFAVDRGVQLHGGFGFTYDCDVHFYFKRSLWSAPTLGDAAQQRGELARALCS